MKGTFLIQDQSVRLNEVGSFTETDSKFLFAAAIQGVCVLYFWGSHDIAEDCLQISTSLNNFVNVLS